MVRNWQRKKLCCLSISLAETKWCKFPENQRGGNLEERACLGISDPKNNAQRDGVSLIEGLYFQISRNQGRSIMHLDRIKCISCVMEKVTPIAPLCTSEIPTYLFVSMAQLMLWYQTIPWRQQFKTTRTSLVLHLT